MVTIAVNASIMGIIMIANGPDIPSLDINRMCQDSAGSAVSKTCLSEEKYALRKLRKYWHRIPKEYKVQCIADSSTPDRSYTFLRDCINNNMMLQKNDETH